MNLVFIGPQASGKGTQAKIVANELGLVHISTGDLVRGATGDLKLKIDGYINKGNLVPDELMIEILKKRLELEEEKGKGFILDGFPRNLVQARELEKITQIDKFVEISISDEEALKRLSGRVNCTNCGMSYNLVTSPKPKKGGVCDKCGEKLYKREDDNEEAIKKRLEIYHNETELILKEYPSVNINGEQSIEEVTKDVLEELEKD